MSKEQIEEMANKPSLERQRRGEYVRRIFEAVRYKGTEDHEDVWSILWDFQEEIKEGYRKQSAWISVDERLPDEFVSVLGYMTDSGDFPPVRECYLVGKVFFFPALKDRHPVSHWMPLPEPPKMKGGTE